MKKHFIYVWIVSLCIFAVGCQKQKKNDVVKKASRKPTTTTTTAAKTTDKPTNESTKKVMDKALELMKAHPSYSQTKRMEDGYTDCSSYVWRVYRSVGITFGDTTYAPTAADIAYWCHQEGKSLSLDKAKADSTYLQPGDLVFYAKSQGDNGRYKNIAHLGIYAGKSEILHADGTPPMYGKVWYRKAVAVSRPTRR